MKNGTHWKESYLNEKGEMEGGNRDAEEIFFDGIAGQIKELITSFEAGNTLPMRGNHAKILAGVVGVQFRVADDLPADLHAGFLIPGKIYKAITRFSNANGKVSEDDSKPDFRGATIRVETPNGDHDFLMTNAEPHHAIDAREAMVAIMSGVEKEIIADKIPDSFPGQDAIAGLVGALPYLISHLGLKRGWQIAMTLKKQMNVKVESLATETYWSRAPIAIGNVPDSARSIAVKYRLMPVIAKPEKVEGEKDLGKELRDRIYKEDTTFLFQVQRFMNETDTPIEDATVAWASEFKTIAELVIPRHAEINNEYVDNLLFSPWNIDRTCFLPVGSMNRSRKKVYNASAGMRSSSIKS